MAESTKENQGTTAGQRFLARFAAFYDAHYKKILVIPFIILLLSLAVLGFKYATTGEFFEKDVSLKGGVAVTFTADAGQSTGIQEAVASAFPGRDLSFRTITRLGEVTGITVAASDIASEVIVSTVQSHFGELTYSVEEMGSSLGSSFFRETFLAIILAFLFMGAVVFFYFRKLVPALAIILSAFSNVVFALAVVNLIGMRLSTAGIAAFLMLIGYSVDTNILLSTRVLTKKEGTVVERILGAMSTGLLMTLTTLSSLTLGAIFTSSDALRQIMLILIAGLIMEILNTWVQNAGILRLYLERKAHHG